MDKPAVHEERYMKKIALSILALMFALAMQTAAHAGEEPQPRMLGVKVRPVTAEESKKLGLADVKGLLVEAVKEESPAAAAGIRENDVIVAVNGKSVETVGEFDDAVAKSGSPMQIDVSRDGWEKPFFVKFPKTGKPGDNKPASARNADRAKLIREMKRIIAEHEAEAARLKKLLDEIEKKEQPMKEDAPKTEEPPPVTKKPDMEPPKTEKGKPYLGIGVETADGGLRITEIEENSPAAKARLKIGDILAAAGKTKLAGLDDLKKVLSESAPGDPVDFTIIRGGDTARVMVFLGARPDETGEPEKPAPVQPPKSSVHLGVSAELNDAGEIVVTDVEKNAAADQGGVKIGDVLVEADGVKLQGLNDLRIALANFKVVGKVSMDLTILRNNKQMHLKIPFGGER